MRHLPWTLLTICIMSSPSRNTDWPVCLCTIILLQVTFHKAPPPPPAGRSVCDQRRRCRPQTALHPVQEATALIIVSSCGYRCIFSHL